MSEFRTHGADSAIDDEMLEASEPLFAIAGHDGRVGKAIARAVVAAGQSFINLGLSLSPLRGKVVIDARHAGNAWPGHCKALADTLTLIARCERERAAAIVLFGSAWAGMPGRDSYGASKRLVLQIAADQNAYGSIPCIADMVGLQLHPDEATEGLSKWELCQRQADLELGSRIIVGLQQVLAARAAGQDQPEKDA